MTKPIIYHIVVEAEYRAGNDGERYLPARFHQDGFVHCSFEASVLPVANDYYAGINDPLLLLRIDSSQLTSSTRHEPASPTPAAGTQHVLTSPLFPHVYGPIDNSAVEGIGILRKTDSGYEWPASFLSVAEFLGQEDKSSA